jgi:hypothetical protein
MSAGNHIRNPSEMALEQFSSAVSEAGLSTKAHLHPRAAPVIRRIGVRGDRPLAALSPKPGQPLIG